VANDKSEHIREMFRQGTPIVDAVRRAVQIALWKHKRLGNPIATWRDGQVVWIPPEEIEVEDPGPLPAGWSDEL
jgi:hypothetical protein